MKTLKNKRGEGYIDTVIILIISVVVGALLLGGVYLLLNSTVIPGLGEKLGEVLN